MTDDENAAEARKKTEEERNKITAETILINRGFATRNPDGTLTHTGAGQAKGTQNMSHEEVINKFSGGDLHGLEFGDQA